jgi:hypothetical protein
MLQLGSGLAGLTLAQLLAGRRQAEAAGLLPKADACIVIHLNGGPSHLDMWDMKPAAPAGIRGEFRAIDTSQAGTQVCEHLPRLARHMHRTTLVRSMHHSVNNSHAEAVYTSLTGHDRGDGTRLTGTGSQDHPTPGATLALLRPAATDRVPHVVLPYMTKEGRNGPPQPGFFGGLLGRGYDPLFILQDPDSPDFRVPELTLSSDVSPVRLAGRRQLLEHVDQWFASPLGEQSLKAMDEFQRSALNLLTSSAARQALAIDQEPAAKRTAYGRNIYGQSVLLARRMIEAGTRAVTVSWAPDANATWDTHGGNFVKLRETLLPQFDQACSALLADLAERGLLERTIVAVLGDFGRSPKVNAAAGRDHWNYCYSVLLAGGGFKGGYVHGASDRSGAFPARDALTPADVIATLYQQLGIRPDTILHDQLGRPHRLVPTGNGQPALVV